MIAAGSNDDIGGITGLIFEVIDRLGAVGLALLNVVDTFFPPIPSEVFLPVAGYLASQDRLGIVAAWVGATIGSLAGALMLYGVGRWLGRARVDRALSHLPLVTSDELDDAQDWFDRHGTSSVLLGRLVPGVRSLVSFPAGTTEMPIVWFSGLTLLGSGVWNAVLIAAGWALGDQWGQVEQYSSWIDLGLVAVAVALIVRFVVKRRDRIGGNADGDDEHGHEHGSDGHARPRRSRSTTT